MFCGYLVLKCVVFLLFSDFSEFSEFCVLVLLLERKLISVLRLLISLERIVLLVEFGGIWCRKLVVFEFLCGVLMLVVEVIRLGCMVVM